MYWDRFDIIEAWYLALSHCHSGMMSKEYKRLSKILSYFRPACNLSVETLTENGKEIYESVCERLLSS